MAPGDPLTQRRLAREQIMFETRNAAEEKRRVCCCAALCPPGDEVGG